MLVSYATEVSGDSVACSLQLPRWPLGVPVTKERLMLEQVDGAGEIDACTPSPLPINSHVGIIRQPFWRQVGRHGSWRQRFLSLQRFSPLSLP